MSITRSRLTQTESRAAAVDAARALLIEQGPQAVTLKAVAARIGRTHANVLHHFGSAAGLQAELARSLAESVTGTIGETVVRARSGQADAREIVDRTFDAFDREGAGALAAWMILGGDREALNPILESIRVLVAELSVGHEEHHVAQTTLGLVLTALGDALLGASISAALGLDRDTARHAATQRLRYQLEKQHPAPDGEGGNPA